MVTDPPNSVLSRSHLLILGMRDSASRELVAEALCSLPGVVQCDVSLFHAMATIVHSCNCTPQALVAAVEQLGFSARALPAHAE